MEYDLPSPDFPVALAFTEETAREWPGKALRRAARITHAPAQCRKVAIQRL